MNLQMYMEEHLLLTSLVLPVLLFLSRTREDSLRVTLTDVRFIRPGDCYP